MCVTVVETKANQHAQKKCMGNHLYFYYRKVVLSIVNPQSLLFFRNFNGFLFFISGRYTTMQNKRNNKYHELGVQSFFFSVKRSNSSIIIIHPVFDKNIYL